VKRPLLACIFCPIVVLVLLSACQKQESAKKVVASEVSEKSVANEVPASQVATPSDDSITNLPKPTTLEDQFSYTYGYMLFLTLKSQGFESLGGSYFARGALDAFKGNTFYTQDEMAGILRQVQANMLEQAKSELKTLAENNLKEANDFLDQNKASSEVVSLPDGLQYQILSKGDVSKPLIGEHDTVTLDYKVTTLDGTLIDSTYRRGQSETIEVSTMNLPGIREAMMQMYPNSKYRFWVPSQLAYGEDGSQSVEPNKLLVIDAEVKQVEYAKAQ
jgi:FKBP-type peptidyl-prolyl cis-trans isomerase